MNMSVVQTILPFVFGKMLALDNEGTMAIILPHGVLFRGGAEAEIRTKLLKDGNIDTVIGLPAKLGIKAHFFGWIFLTENAPLIGQRIAMRNIKFVIFHPVQQHIHSC
jgi:hypothetical protein